MKRRHVISLFITLHVGCVSVIAQESPTWSLSLDSVTIRGSRYTSPVKQKADGSIEWNLGMMDDMPKILGNADPVHFTQMLPGVQTNNEFRSSVNIQGCDHSHSRVSIAGVPIYNVSHLLGFFSVFNGSHYPSMRLAKMPMSSAASNVLGGELTMLLADTVPKHFSGEATIGLISSQGTLRMPLSPKMSLTFSARRSYLNMLYSQWLKADGQTIHYSFYDVNATLLYKANKTNSLLLDVYHGNDKVSFEEDRYLSNMKDTWGNTSVALHWLAGGQRGVNSKQSLYLTSYHNKFGLSMQGMSLELPSAIMDIGYRGLVKWNRWNMGAEAVWHHIEPQRVEAVNVPFSYAKVPFTDSYEGSLSADYTWPITSHVKLTGGLRWNIYHLSGYTTSSLNPNLSLSYESYNTQLMAGYAVRHQYLLQTGFSNMGLPTEFWLSCGDGRSPQYAHEFSLTAAQYLFRHRYRISMDVFYRKLYHQVEFSGSVLDYFNTKADLNKQMLFGHGENYGFNIMLNKCSGRLTGWLSYSYTQAKRRFESLGTQRYPASHERPHEVNVVGTYTLNSHWSVGGVFVYASGTPFTAPAYVAMYNQNLLISYGEHNANRLKPYVRLDLSVNYKWRGRWIRENGINFSLYNATSKSNEIFYYISTDDDGSFAYKATKFQLRILPSVSYFCKF